MKQRENQWRPGIGSDIVARKAVAGITFCAVNDACAFHQSTGGCFTLERHGR